MMLSVQLGFSFTVLELWAGFSLSFLFYTAWILFCFMSLSCQSLYWGKVLSLTMFNLCSIPIDVSLARKRVLQRGHLPLFSSLSDKMVCFSINFNSSLIYFWTLCPCWFFAFIFARHGVFLPDQSLFIIKWTLVLRLGCLLFFVYSRQTERSDIRPIIFHVVLKFHIFRSKWFSSLLKIIIKHNLITNLYGQHGFFLTEEHL